MDSLQSHHRSLTEHLNKVFKEFAEKTAGYELDLELRDQQIRDLQSTLRTQKGHELNVRNVKAIMGQQQEELEREITTLKEERKTDELRIQKLQSEIAQLKSAGETTATPTRKAKLDEDEKEEERENLDQKLRLLAQTYGPEKVAQEARQKGSSEDAFMHTETLYRRLYDETVTLVRASGSLRSQVKHYKERAAQWQRWLSGNRASKPSPGLANLGVDEDVHTPKVRPDQEPSSHLEDVSRGLETPLTSALPPARLTGVVQNATSCDNSDDMESTELNTMSTASASSPHEEGECHPKFDGGDQATIRIKTEPLSPGSPPQASSPGDVMQPSGSQDLDEVGDVVRTPRSRKFTVFEDDIIFGSRPDAQINTMNKYQGQRHAFQPKDTNQWPRPRELSSKRRRTGDSGASAISSVSEDGDEDYRRYSRRKAQREIETPCKVSTRNPEAHQRLDDLLSARPYKHSPALNPSLVRTPGISTTPSGGTKNKKTIEDWMKPKSKRPATKRIHPHGPNIEHDEEVEEDWNAVIKSVPYRERPIDCLDLSCFKPNPAKNQGLDYAYSEVVRNHEQRKCLPGCMRADCCGEKFRAMVRAGGVKYDDGKHHSLLEDFLGDQKHALDTLSDTSRDALFVEAKARQLANQFGKHRQAYERPRSPPGFWRTEMPSTQELAKDRIEADRMEREKVLDRVREALRPDGAWRFADEVD